MNEVLVNLVHANTAMVAAILLVLVLRAVVRWRFGASAAYHLWAAVPAAAMASALPPLPPHFSAAMTPPSGTPWSAALHWSDQIASPGDWQLLVFSLWVLGVAASAYLVISKQRQFIRLAEAGAAGPAVLGVFRPTVIVPADFASRYTGDERRVILAHERYHLIQHDALINGLITLAQCLCWFNPLIHVAAFCARSDQELACDANVMLRFPNDRRAYAEAMLKTQLASTSLPLGCHWPSRSIHPLEERIAMLNRSRPSRSWRVAGAVLVGALCLGTAFATTAADNLRPLAATAANSFAGLTMRLVDERPSAAPQTGSELIVSPDGDMRLEPEVLITGDMVANATPSTDANGHPVVRFQLNSEGRSRLAALTSANIGRRLAIIVNGTVVTAPLIREEIAGGAGQISARGWSLAEAEAVATAIAPLQP